MTKRRISRILPNVRGPLMLAASAALAVSACSREAGSNQPDDAPTTIAAPAPAPVPTATATPTVAAIPAAMRGRWGLVAADCAPGSDVAKGLMEVGAKTLTFYESRASLKSVRTAEPGRIRGDFAFSGEGQDWTQDIELRAWNGTAQLIREDRGPDAPPGPLTYTRCAG